MKETHPIPTIPKQGEPNRLKVLKQILFTTGDEIAAHLVETHNGLPASTCHRCITLKETYRNFQDLVAQEEAINRSLRKSTKLPTNRARKNN